MSSRFSRLLTGPGRATWPSFWPVGYRLMTLASSFPPAMGPWSLPLLSSARISSRVIHFASDVSARAWAVDRSGLIIVGTCAATVVYFHVDPGIVKVWSP
jgi:hypothetical protein